jgi:predicted ribosome quality control (RQC) complex YloA/Tae2 family protein
MGKERMTALDVRAVVAELKMKLLGSNMLFLVFHFDSSFVFKREDWNRIVQTFVAIAHAGICAFVSGLRVANIYNLSNRTFLFKFAGGIEMKEQLLVERFVDEMIMNEVCIEVHALASA